MESAIEELTKLKIKEFDEIQKTNKKKYYKVEKTKLIDFCIKLIKLVEREIK